MLFFNCYISVTFLLKNHNKTDKSQVDFKKTFKI